MEAPLLRPASAGALSETATSQPTNRLGTGNDADALALFLRRAERRSAETLRRYTRELVRFTAFCRKELLKNYDQITVADIEGYVTFLNAPWPHWQLPGIDRSRPDKVYFPNAIKPGKSTDQVITVLHSFFNYLHATGYIQGNPVHGFDKSGERHARGHGEVRYFYADEWDVVKSCLKHYPEDTKRQQGEKARLNFIFGLTYATAMRQGEIERLSCADILPGPDGELELHISGKGRRKRRLPVNDRTLDIIIRYRQHHKQEAFCRDGFPLAPTICPVKKDGSYGRMSARQIRKWFAGFMLHCADSVEKENPELAQRLLEKSFHSLRHTALSHLARNMDIEDLAIFAGHEAITTTQQYYTPERSRLRELTREHGLD
ncbi:tyrosine-type recombinase/integrase [Endozoicomonadaceae bacterium StTr2]